MKKFILLILLILSLGACSSIKSNETAFNEPPIGTENSSVGSDILPGITSPSYEGSETSSGYTGQS